MHFELPRRIGVANCLGISVVVACSQQLSSDAAGLANVEEGQPGWVLEAEQLITELNDVASETPRKEGYSWSRDEITRSQRTADRLLWRLWQVTGMPPLPQEQDTTIEYVRRNALAYEKYILKHRDLTLEELCRLGLDNAVESIGSPLWYLTMRYLVMKAGIESDRHIIVNTTPSRPLTVSTMSRGTYARQSAALARWLKANRQELVWDAAAKCFRPRNGKYVGTDELFESLSPQKKEQ